MEGAGKAIGAMIVTTLLIVTACGCLWLLREAFSWLG